MSNSMKNIVLGRFQPFHNGHEALIQQALERCSGEKLMIAIGSANAELSINNPWTATEREEMITAWASEKGVKDDVEFCHIPDINDPPNWVKHASKYHGTRGILHTSDSKTAELYRLSQWKVVEHKLHKRESLEGWRVRTTMKMMYDIPETNTGRHVLSILIPNIVSSDKLEQIGIILIL